MNWIESSIEGSKLFICSGCTCREAIFDQEKEAAGRLAESFYCRRDFTGCPAKSSPSVSVETIDSVKSNAGREGCDGSNCDRVFILFDIFHCSNCDNELQEDRTVYGEINENINQISEELNEMHQRLKKLLLRNCSTEFPPMESITSNVSYGSSEVIHNRVHGSAINDTEIKNKEESITPNVSYEWSGMIDNNVHSFVLKDTEIKHKEDDGQKLKSNSKDKTKEIDDHKKELITSSVSYEWSGVIDNRVHGLVNKDTKTKHREDDIRKQRSMSEDKIKDAVDHKKELMTSKVSYESSWEIDKGVHDLVFKDIEIKQKEDTIVSNVSYGSYVEIDNRVHGSVFNVTEIKNQEDDIRKQMSMSEDKEKETVDLKLESIRPNVSYEQSEVFENRVRRSVLKDIGIKHKEESITSNVSYESFGEIDNRVHGSFLSDTEIKNKETSTYRQNTRLPGRQRLQRKENIWPGSVLMETEIKPGDKTRPRRQRLERGSDVFGDGVNGSVLKNAETKLKDIQDDDIPNPWSNSNVKAKGTIDDNKFQDYIPNPESTSEDESEETVGDKKETVDSIPSNVSKSEGFEVIGEGVPEIKRKDTSSHSQKVRPRRQRLQRKGQVWPGYEVMGDGVHGSILMDTEIKHASIYNQKTRERRQRLQRKEIIWPGA